MRQAFLDRDDAALIKAHMKSAAESIIQVGLALKRQKERMGHGLFMAWVRDECGMSDRTANRLMKVAKDLSNSPSMANFSGLGTTALELLVSDSTPQEVRDQVQELLVDGEKVTVADIKRLKAEAKGAQGTIEILAARNSELASKPQASEEQLDIEVESIKACIPPGGMYGEGRLSAPPCLRCDDGHGLVVPGDQFAEVHFGKLGVTEMQHVRDYRGIGSPLAEVSPAASRKARGKKSRASWLNRP